jgi:2-C-methyl-D-erythritol 4-phosphate cytidylyltransferase
MGSGTPKQFLALGGLPVLVHSLRVLEKSESITGVILAVAEADREFCLTEIVSRHGFAKVRQVVAGGMQRQDSVRLGLAAVEESADLVLVHDAVRPFFTPDLVNRVVGKAAKQGAAVVAIPMRDTVKRVGADNLIENTVDRRRLWLAQTPQVFRRALLEEAHRKAQEDGFEATDDAQLVERLGYRVAIVEGTGENIKITQPEDLAIGEAILVARLNRAS